MNSVEKFHQVCRVVTVAADRLPRDHILQCAADEARRGLELSDPGDVQFLASTVRALCLTWREHPGPEVVRQLSRIAAGEYLEPEGEVK